MVLSQPAYHIKNHSILVCLAPCVSDLHTYDFQWYLAHHDEATITGSGQLREHITKKPPKHKNLGIVSLFARPQLQGTEAIEMKAKLRDTAKMITT